MKAYVKLLEMLKHAEWARTPANLHHYRAGDQEVDLILESWVGDVACVEVKSTVSLSRRDWRPMAQVRDRLGNTGLAGGRHKCWAKERLSRSR